MERIKTMRFKNLEPALSIFSAGEILIVTDDRDGLTTGISAQQRSTTVKTLAVSELIAFRMDELQ